MPHELPIPEFLQETEEEIHRRMLEKSPPGISTREGDFYWDATRPTAIEKAEMTQLKLQNILRLAFPQTSYGQYLKFLGEMKGVFQHEATPATGTIQMAGQPGASIPSGFIVFTEDGGALPAIGFILTETAKIGQDGTVLVNAECMEPGTIGNVAANTIVLLERFLNGVSSVTNPEPTSGGTEIEDEESFRNRILAAYDEPLSGAKKDYERWAKEVPGVGEVYPIPLANGPGTITVLITDSNGQPANQALIDAVQAHIAPDGRKGGGLAPIGALVTIDAPEVLIINVSATLIMESDYSLDTIEDVLLDNLREFLSEFEINTGDRPLGRITTTRLGYAILDTEGIVDYENLTVNNGLFVEIPVGEVPVLGEVTLT